MDALILALIKEHYKLRATTLFHILNGKRTSSTLISAYFSDILPFSGCLPRLTLSEFNETIDRLHKQKKLLLTNDGILSLPKDATPTFILETPFYFYNAFEFGRNDLYCWRLIQFAVQALSYQQVTNRYIPIETAPQYTERIRAWLALKDTTKDGFYEELVFIFDQLPQKVADFLAATFSGHQQIGQTSFQLVPQQFQEQPLQKIYEAACIHGFLSVVKKQPDFQLARLLISPLKANYNQSMLLSVEMFQKGKTVEQVMAIRKLKRGTVNDHVIEWALLSDQFPFHLFISEKQAKQLEKLPSDAWKKSYQELKKMIEVDFLILRLYQIKQKRGSLC